MEAGKARCSPIPAMSMVSYAGGSRLLQLFGGAVLSFYDMYADFPPASPETWGEKTDAAESADWYNSKFIVTVGSNLTYSLTVTNLGPLAATSVTVTDALPASVAFVSASVSQGTWATNAGRLPCPTAAHPRPGATPGLQSPRFQSPSSPGPRYRAAPSGRAK